MKVWVYKGFLKSGENVSGKIKSRSCLIAQANLLNKGIKTTSITEFVEYKQDDKSVWLNTNDKDLDLDRLNFIHQNLIIQNSTVSKIKIPQKQVYVFIRQFTVIIKSGISILKAFDMLISGQENSKFAGILSDIKFNLENGMSLKDSFAKYPNVFDKLFISFIGIGEHSGVLDVLLERYLDYINRVTTIKRKIRQSLSYPIIVLFISCLVLGGVLGFIVPSFEDVFIDFHVQLPFATVIVIKLSKIIIQYWWLFLCIVTGLTFLFRYLFSKFARFRYYVEILLFKLPILGKLLYKSIIARWSRGLALLFGAGIPLIDSLRLITSVLDNYLYGLSMLTLEKHVTQGTSFNEALKSTGIFPDLVVQMVLVGEESGCLDNMLNAIAEYYEQDVTSIIDIILAMIEPITIVLLGIILGAIIVAIYLPIFDLGNVIG